MSSPRSRLYSRLLVFVSVLWAVGFALVCVRVCVLSRRLSFVSDSVEMRLASIESALSGLSDSPASVSAPDNPQENLSPLSFRVLGSGTLKNWVYLDISFPDSTVNRYYSRRGDSLSLSNTIDRIRADSLCHLPLASGNPSPETF